MIHRMGIDKTTNSYTFQIKRSIAVLAKPDRRRLLLVFVVQVFLGFLDLVGIFLIGLVSALAVSSVSGNLPSKTLANILSFVSLSGFTSQYQALILGGLAASALVVKTLFSAYFSRRILFFLSRKSAIVSSELVSRFLNRPLQLVSTNSMQSSLYALTIGVQSVLVGVVGSVLLIASDLFLVLFLVISLAIVDTGVALLSIIIFAGTGVTLYLSVHRRAERNGKVSAELTISSNQTIVEVFSGYREILIRNRRSHYLKLISEQRVKLASALAENAFIPSIGKYTLEIVIVLSGIIISAYQFWLNSATQAVGILSIYLVASSRMAPAILRIQQSAINIKTNLGMATPTLSLIEELSSVPPLQVTEDFPIDSNFDGFDPRISVVDLSLKYPGRNDLALQNISITIQPGSFVGIVGESGAGKSSLMDCMLGVMNPLSGEVKISGLDPLAAFAKWPGSVGYVPQNVFITNGSIRENITLGFSSRDASESDINECLRQAQMLDFVESLPSGLDTQIQDFESQLSGGQQQRLGIARALFTKPKLIMLDEATSALDGKTETEISDAIHSLKGQVTLVVIAHRLSTIRNADQVIYMKDGKITATGKFEEVRNSVPDFEKQVKLMSQ